MATKAQIKGAMRKSGKAAPAGKKPSGVPVDMAKMAEKIGKRVGAKGC